MRIYDGFVSETPINAFGRTVPALTPMLCIENIGGKTPVFLLEAGGDHCVLKMNKTAADKLTPIQNDPALDALVKQHMWCRAQLTPVLTRECQAGDVVEVKQRVELGDGACLVKGQRLFCEEGGNSPTFTFFHPLTYARMQMTWPHEDVKFAFSLVTEPAQLHEERFAKASGIRMEWTEYGDGQFMGSLICPGGQLPVYQRTDRAEVSRLYLESLVLGEVVERLYSTVTLSEAIELGGRVRDIPEEQLLSRVVDYHRTSAVKLMSFGAYLLLANKQAEAQAIGSASRRKPLLACPI
jgi:hypothetical protein